MAFVGVFMMPFYWGSKARSIAEYLRMRFDEKTRALNAITFVIMIIFSSGVSMYAIAKLIMSLEIFDKLFEQMGLGTSPIAIFTACSVLGGLVVVIYVYLGGLTGAIYNQVLQFFLIVVGFLPLVCLGLYHVGGWNGLVQRIQDKSPIVKVTDEMKASLHRAEVPEAVLTKLKELKDKEFAKPADLTKALETDLSSEDRQRWHEFTDLYVVGGWNGLLTKNQDKPGPVQVTDDTLAALHRQEVPQAIFAKLDELKGKDLTSDELARGAGRQLENHRGTSELAGHY